MHAADSVGASGTCEKHWTQRASFTCDDCGLFWCEDCRVPPVRKRAPVRCISCALVAGGVKMRGPSRGPLPNMNSTTKRPLGKF